jgi:hypothetical protein
VQEKLFYEDEFEALSLMISNSEKTFGQVAQHLFPTKKYESAYARLKACLNPEKDERLTFGEIIAAMKFCECYTPLMFACDETLHARPDRKAAKDEEVRLVEAINGAADVMRRAMSKLENLKRAQA